jgi:putative ABC transport system ATP-binding protein
VSAAALRAESLYRFFHAGDEEVAVVGPSGSGKSTLLGCLAGMDEPDGGTVWLAGRRLSRRPEPERSAMRASSVGMLFQSGNLLEHLSVAANLALAQRLAGRREPARIAALLADLGLTTRAGARPSELSGGELCRAGLANQPAVLLADEPTGEVDSATERRVLDLLTARAQAGVAVVVVTHSDAVAAVADRVVTLVDGSIPR